MAINSSSSFGLVLGDNTIYPLRSNIQRTAPSPANLPPCWLKMPFTSPSVLFLLSVIPSIMIATPPTPNPSKETSSKFSPANSPVPFLIARSIFSLGMLNSLAFSMAAFSWILLVMSLPLSFTARVITRAILEKIFPFFASLAFLVAATVLK